MTRIVTVGDSSTYGALLPGKYAWPARLQRRLESDGAYEVVNCAVPGANVEDGLAQQLHQAAAWDAQLVTIWIGYNSAANPEALESLSEQVGAFAARRAADGRRTMLLTIPMVAVVKGGARARLLEHLRSIGEDPSVELVDVASWLGSRPWDFTLDGLHPSQLGQRRIAARMEPLVRAVGRAK